mgnify:FL=1
MESKHTVNPKDIELNLNSNQINVSNRKNKSFYVFLAKKILEKHDDLVMNALGNASTISVMAAESLVRNGYAEYAKLETQTIDVEQNRGGRKGGKEGDAEAPKTTQRVSKLLITLKKSKDFDKNMAAFAKIKEENEKMMEAENAGKPTAK